jgi:ATP-binding cassette subfamily B protein
METKEVGKAPVYLLHPYYGYTMNPNWIEEYRREVGNTDAGQLLIDDLINAYGFFGNTPPIQKYDPRKFIVGITGGSVAAYAGAWGRQKFINELKQIPIAQDREIVLLNFGQAVIFTVGMTVAMVLSARGVINGTLTVGDFVMINALMIQLSIPLNFLGMVYREIKQGLVDLETMFALVEEAPEVTDKPGAPPLAASKGAIKFENVSFAYDPARPILKSVSFEVPAGQMVAIVGPSGAGKSTISRILFRFYDISAGRVTIDGHDIRDVTQASVRAAIGVVPQDTVLFNDTILYNIRYGRPDASDADIEEAAQLAQIDGFIRTMPDGYKSMVGERGLKLSGGEKQRIAIARTILKGPPILILDEATSALDSHTEREIQSALDRVAKDRTTLVIAHRLSTIIHADQIIVLDKGEIVERGTHSELIAKGGLYASLWDRQRQAEKAREDLAAALEAAQKAGALREADLTLPGVV